MLKPFIKKVWTNLIIINNNNNLLIQSKVVFHPLFLSMEKTFFSLFSEKMFIYFIDPDEPMMQHFVI